MKIICKDKELIPTKGTEGSAGFDLRLSADIQIPANRSVKVGTGVHVEIPYGFMGLVVPRSSTGKKGLGLANTVGVIDSDYQGEILLNIFNRNNSPYLGYKYDTLFQLIIVPVGSAELEVVSSFTKITKRGKNGFGSTGT